jgi:hypothetical protein
MYDVVVLWENNIPKFNRIPLQIAKCAQEISKNFIKEFNREQKFNLLHTRLDRYDPGIFDAVCIYLKAQGYSTEISYSSMTDTTPIFRMRKIK